MFRFGSWGESAAYRKIATIFRVGDCKTISIITKRILRVFLCLQSKYINWQYAIKQSKTVSDIFDEQPFCIRYIDGTEIKWAESPIKDHTSYFSRNHIYSIRAQLGCDYKRVVQHVVVGHPRSWHNARIYRNSSIFLHSIELLGTRHTLYLER